MIETPEDLAVFEADTASIDPMDLNREFCELPPRLAYWNAQLAAATQRAMEAKADLETERARQLLEVREGCKLAGGKAPTVDEVNAQVLLHEDVQDAQAIYIEKEAERLRLKGIVDSLLTKRDMLQSLGAKLRVEMMADPVLRDQIAAASGVSFGGRE